VIQVTLLHLSGMLTSYKYFCYKCFTCSFITFRVSRRRHEMYYGHPCLCVCPRPHAYTIAWTRM